mgnify:FL=1
MGVSSRVEKSGRPLRPSEPDLNELELLRRVASSKLPFRLLTADDISAAKALMASGHVKVSMPRVHNGKNTYGKQDDAVVSAITPAGRRALLE